MGKINNFFKKIKANKNFELIIAIVLCVVIVILFLSSFWESPAKDNINDGADTLFNYNQQLEKKICDLILSLEGVKDVSVVISYSSGTKTIYAYETTVVTSGGVQTETTEIVFVDGKPLVVGEISPEILGVAIVAKATGNTNAAVLKLQITELVVKLFNINSNKIQIITYSN